MLNKIYVCFFGPHSAEDFEITVFVVIVIKQNQMNHVRILYSGINQIIGLKYFLWRPG